MGVFWRNTPLSGILDCGDERRPRIYCRKTLLGDHDHADPAEMGPVHGIRFFPQGKMIPNGTFWMAKVPIHKDGFGENSPAGVPDPDRMHGFAGISLRYPGGVGEMLQNPAKDREQL
jgi:hypothetical protein